MKKSAHKAVHYHKNGAATAKLYIKYDIDSGSDGNFDGGSDCGSENESYSGIGCADIFSRHIGIITDYFNGEFADAADAVYSAHGYRFKPFVFTAVYTCADMDNRGGENEDGADKNNKRKRRDKARRNHFFHVMITVSRGNEVMAAGEETVRYRLSDGEAYYTGAGIFKRGLF